MNRGAEEGGQLRIGRRTKSRQSTCSGLASQVQPSDMEQPEEPELEELVENSLGSPDELAEVEWEVSSTSRHMLDIQKGPAVFLAAPFRCRFFFFSPSETRRWAIESVGKEQKGRGRVFYSHVQEKP